MRTSTKRKTYGRSAIAQSLRAAKQDLERAVDAFGTYPVGRKRMWGRILNEIGVVNGMLKEVASWPITPDEKVLAKHNGAPQDASLEGIITDPNSGESVAGIKVTAFGKSTFTDKRGHYLITGLKPGKYDAKLVWGLDPITGRKFVTLSGEILPPGAVAPLELNGGIHISPAPPAVPKTANPSPPKKQAPQKPYRTNPAPGMQATRVAARRVKNGTRSNRKAETRTKVPAQGSPRRRRQTVRSNSGGAVKGKARDRKTPAHS